MIVQILTGRLVAKEGAKEAKVDIAFAPPPPTNPNVTPKLEVIYAPPPF